MAQWRPSITIEQIAQHLGLAKGTVSRVLKNYSDISSATRDRTLAAIDELGYRPSSTARRLKSGRVETVGIVLPVSTTPISDPVLAEFLDGVSEALGRHDMDLLVTTARDPTDAAVVFERLIAAAKVDGYIVTRTLTDDPRISFLVRFDIPFFAHGRTAGPSGYAWLDVDNEGAPPVSTRRRRCSVRRMRLPPCARCARSGSPLVGMFPSSAMTAFRSQPTSIRRSRRSPRTREMPASASPRC